MRSQWGFSTVKALDVIFKKMRQKEYEWLDDYIGLDPVRTRQWLANQLHEYVWLIKMGL